jgi:tubulin--tyrosine ligase-like protein 12
LLPQLLEFSFGPDTERACKYTPSYYNDVFGCLFRDEEHNVTRI